MDKVIIHQLSLTGIGGVQQSFIPYFKNTLKYSNFKHFIFGVHKIDNEYQEVQKYYFNISNSYKTKLKFLYYLFSSKYIIHFYNNLGSSSVKNLLKRIPVSNIIFHERGTAWNLDVFRYGNIYRENASKAKLIIANSNATKIMLNQKFDIPNEKIKVIYNGFLEHKEIPLKQLKSKDVFKIGFIGRFDTPKGVHLFIKAAKYLPQFKFFLAGDGPWKNLLLELSKNLSNVFFVGRIANPINFIQKMDLIIVPSIREPLGNVIIEAGFCKKAVIATEVDGIPEILSHNYSGVLLKPIKPLSIKQLPRNSVAYPEYVVIDKALSGPRELDVEELVDNILYLYRNPEKRIFYGQNLFKTVINRFSLTNYFYSIENIYKCL